jgi:hypothetical protein
MSLQGLKGLPLHNINLLDSGFVVFKPDLLHAPSCSIQNANCETSHTDHLRVQVMSSLLDQAIERMKSDSRTLVRAARHVLDSAKGSTFFLLPFEKILRKDSAASDYIVAA